MQNDREIQRLHAFIQYCRLCGFVGLAAAFEQILTDLLEAA